jgi:FkbM family methyltransferase
MIKKLYKTIKRIIFFYYKPIIKEPLLWTLIFNRKIPERFFSFKSYQAYVNKIKTYKNICKTMGWKVYYRKGIYFLLFKNNKILFYQNPAGNLKEVYGYFRNYDFQRHENIVDGGAFVGLFSLIVSKIVNDGSKIIAFESDKENYQLLLKNIDLNNSKNIIPVNIGLWSEKCELLFSTGKEDSNGVFLSEHEINLMSAKTMVDSLDNQLRKLNINKIGFIKLDVEGAEIEVLKGARDTLKTNDVHLAIASYHIFNNEPTFKEVEKTLTKFGYYSFTEYPQHLTTYGYKEKH